MKKLFTALLVGALVLSGCTNNDSEGKYDTNIYKDYYLANSGDYETLNYLNTSAAVNLRTVTQFVDGLTENDKYGRTVSSLATSWESNEDYTVWTFHLREGVKWVDWEGNEVAEVTADDFVYAAEYVLNPLTKSSQTSMYQAVKGASAYNSQKKKYLKQEGQLALSEGETLPTGVEDVEFSDMVGVKAVDKYTVEYTMEESTAYFISLTLYGCYMPANREFVEGLPASGALSGLEMFGSDKQHILYCGPWLFTVDEKNSKREYSKNKTYWDIDNVHFDKVEVIAIADNDAAWTFFQEGDISYGSVSLTQYEAHKDDGVVVQIRPGAYAYQIFLNSDTSYSESYNKAVLNENFRLAIRHAFEYDNYAEFTNPLDPKAIIGSGYVIEGLITAPDGTDYADLGPLADYDRSGFFDLDKAEEYKQLAIDELGDTVTWPVEMRYYVPTGNEVEMQKAETVKAFLETNLGSDIITVVIGEYTTLNTEVTNKGLNGITFSGWGADYADPINILETMLPQGRTEDPYSQTGQTGGYMNYRMSHFYEMGDFQELVEKANAETTDIQKRYELFAEAEAYLLDHAYVTPVMQANSTLYLRVTSVNEFERPYSLCGTANTKIKGFTLTDSVITTEAYNKAYEKWTEDRAAAMAEGEWVMED